MKPPLPCLVLFLLALPSLAIVSITTTTLPVATVNTAYSAAIQASGGCAPYSWAITSGSLPPGISQKVSSTTTSLNLSGTPTTAASYSFTVSVTGCNGHIASDAYKMNVQSSSSVAITTATLPNGTVNTPYSAVIQASGGCTPYSWAITSGALPPGVSQKASSSTTSLNLSGTPTTAASYAFTVTVTGCKGRRASDPYKMVIQAGANHVVDLRWNPSTSANIAGYNVYRSPDGATWKKTNVSLIAATTYSDSTVSNGSIYYYASTAVDIYGRESSKTPAVKVTIPTT